MNNPITNAALAKAAEAVLFDLKDRKGVGNEIEQCDDDIQAEIGRTVAAKAIHTFLQALPDEYTEGGAAFWHTIPAHDQKRLWLADAVLAAAKEERE
jgi:hypothetical protein